ncbi:MAG: hypothetical protein RL077_5394, partial [Verrucomicrobiota bacterium]
YPCFILIPLNPSPPQIQFPSNNVDGTLTGYADPRRTNAAVGY